jgi:hypothetical protein
MSFQRFGLPPVGGAVPASAHLALQTSGGSGYSSSVRALLETEEGTSAYVRSVNSLIGGGSSLASIVTAAVGSPGDDTYMPALATGTIRMTWIGVFFQVWVLQTPTFVGVLNTDYVVPADYHASTNNRHWVLGGSRCYSLEVNTLRVQGGFYCTALPGAENIGVVVAVEGQSSWSHTVKIYSGIPGKVNMQADHAHLKHEVTTVTAGTAASRGQLMFSGRTNGTSVYNLHGYGAEIVGTPVANEHSIDTLATVVGAGPQFLGTIKFRYTTNPGLTLNQLVMFAVTGPVAGIQASVYYGIVTQAPALVSGVYEVLVQVARLDGKHWDTNAKANVSTLNERWVIKTLTDGEVNPANKVSLARDTNGPSDQLLVTWGTPHGLLYMQNVSVWASGTITGLSGIWTGFHSGHVSEVVSPTQVRIRVRNLRLQDSSEIYNFSGAVSSATSTWAIVPGTLDPDHEVVLPGNVITMQRDAQGRGRRLMVGTVDVLNDDEWALGVGGPENELRSRFGHLKIGRHSLTTMAGVRSARRGVRCIRTTATTPLVVTGDFGAIPTTNGAGIGAGEFSAVFDGLLDFSGGCIGGITDTACLFQLRLLSTGDIALDTWDGTTTTVTNLGVSFLELNGTRGVLSIRRGTDLSISLNGFEIYSGTPASWDRTLSTAAKLRVGGADTAATRYNGVIYGAWAFAHRVTRSDLDHINAHGRLPSALHWAPYTILYSDPFGSNDGGWVSFGASAPVADQDVGGREDCLKVVINSGGTTHIISKSAILPRAKRVRLTFEVFRPAANAVVTGIIVQPYNQATGRQILQLTGDAWTPVTMDVEDNGASGNTGDLVLYMMNAASAFDFAGNGTDFVAIRNVKAQRLGAFCALDFTAGGGSQVPDLSGNGFHCALTSASEHVVPERRFTLPFRVTQTGSTQIAGASGFLKLPVGTRIASITANAASSVTLSIGNANSGTQIVNAQALTTGIQDVTMAGRFTTTGDLFVTLSSGVQVDLTVECVATGA